jgi:hypothetical protein
LVPGIRGGNYMSVKTPDLSILPKEFFELCELYNVEIQERQPFILIYAQLVDKWELELVNAAIEDLKASNSPLIREMVAILKIRQNQLIQNKKPNALTLDQLKN